MINIKLIAMLENIYVKIELFVLDRNTWNYLVVCKQMRSGSLKKMLPTNYSHKIYI